MSDQQNPPPDWRIIHLPRAPQRIKWVLNVSDLDARAEQIKALRAVVAQQRREKGTP